MITAGLITTTEYSQFNGYPIPTGSKLANLESTIESASRAIEYLTGREYTVTTSSARYYDSQDGRHVYIHDCTAVSAVDADWGYDGTFATPVTAYQLLPVGGRSSLLGSVPYTSIRSTTLATLAFPTAHIRLGAVRVTGVWGWAAVPTPVKHACAVLALDLIRDAEANYGGLVATDVGIIGSRIPKRVKDLCDPFRRLDRGAGVVGIA